jgi:hypothetical protein
MASDYSARVTGSERVSGWATGFVVFAAMMMMLIGSFHAIQGLVAIVDDDFFVVGANYTFEFDTTAWGWLHLIFGVIVFAAGAGVLAGQPWARVVGITLATISAIANFFFIPYYPIWALVIIALDILVIWALAVYGRSAAESAY